MRNVRRVRRTEVTIETDEITIIRGSQHTALFLCCECDEAMAMIAPEEAAAMACTTTRAIYRLVEEGGLHQVEIEGGSLLICPRSLMNRIAARALPPAC